MAESSLDVAFEIILGKILVLLLIDSFYYGSVYCCSNKGFGASNIVDMFMFILFLFYFIGGEVDD